MALMRTLSPMRPCRDEDADAALGAQTAELTRRDGGAQALLKSPPPAALNRHRCAAVFSAASFAAKIGTHYD